MPVGQLHNGNDQLYTEPDQLYIASCGQHRLPLALLPLKRSDTNTAAQALTWTKTRHHA